MLLLQIMWQGPLELQVHAICFFGRYCKCYEISDDAVDHVLRVIEMSPSEW